MNKYSLQSFIRDDSGKLRVFDYYFIDGKTSHNHKSKYIYNENATKAKVEETIDDNEPMPAYVKLDDLLRIIEYGDDTFTTKYVYTDDSKGPNAWTSAETTLDKDNKIKTIYRNNNIVVPCREDPKQFLKSMYYSTTTRKNNDYETHIIDHSIVSKPFINKNSNIRIEIKDESSTLINGERTERKIRSHTNEFYDSDGNHAKTEILVENGNVLDKKKVYNFETKFYDENGNESFKSRQEAFNRSDFYNVIRDNSKAVIITENSDDLRYKSVYKSINEKIVRVLYSVYFMKENKMITKIYNYDSYGNIIDIIDPNNCVHYVFDKFRLSASIESFTDNTCDIKYKMAHTALYYKYPGITKV